MVRRLIINADDYDISPIVNRGIKDAAKAGAVSSVSCLVYDRPVSIADELKSITGIHLRLTDGPALAGRSSLTDESGLFPRDRAGIHDPNLADVRREWDAQVESFLKSGVTPTHIDTHHHVQELVGISVVYGDLAISLAVAAVGVNRTQVLRLRERGIRCADRCSITWNETMDAEDILKAFDGCETVHLVTHPGYSDNSLRPLRSRIETGDVRVMQLDILMSKAFKGFLAKNEIELIGMADLI